MHKSITAEKIIQAVNENTFGTGAYLGYCTECGAEHEGVEPDARKYNCTECGAMSVYGAEELLFGMGLHLGYCMNVSRTRSCVVPW